MAPFSTFVNVFTIGIVLPKRPEAIPAAAHSPVIQVPADRVLHAGVLLRTKVIAFTDFAAAVRQGDLMRLRTIQSWAAVVLDQLHGLILAFIKHTHSRG